MLQIAVQPPARYGSSRAESYDIVAHCSVAAFVSAASFGGPTVALRVCDAASGCAGRVSSDSNKGAHLAGRNGAPAMIGILHRLYLYRARLS